VLGRLGDLDPAQDLGELVGAGRPPLPSAADRATTGSMADRSSIGYCDVAVGSRPSDQS
jgi:hypothetical protein